MFLSLLILPALLSMGDQAVPAVAPAGPLPQVTILKRDELAPGEAAIVEVSAGQSLSFVEGMALGRRIVFWTEGPGIYRGLFGFDRNDTPATYPLVLRFRRDGGGTDSLITELAVRGKDFGVTRLTTPGGKRMLDASVVARIKRERALVDSLLSSQTPERMWRESFTAPLERLTVTGAFGTGRIINGTGSAPHGGLDLRAPMGEPIRASNDGVVALTGEHYYAGRSIYIDHGTGLYSMYFHCEKILVQEGERVTRGQTIGTVGMTGRATGPHLHWGFTLGTARVDPVSVLSLPVRASVRAEAPVP
jgi:murein DD-endopeptidase MepM/ murein hydrolase activator NlpD